MKDRKKQAWIERWEQDNSDVREGWIKRSDGKIGYVYLENPDYVIRGDFLPERGVFRRIWVPWYRRYQIYELQYSGDLKTVMKAVERFAREAGELQGLIMDRREAESV